jgi:hypothetical protein
VVRLRVRLPDRSPGVAACPEVPPARLSVG